MAEISVIVPVYNVEHYIGKCVDSILHQTFQDFEIILVDDGSSDRSGRLCDQYAEKYHNVNVVHKENGGVSSARNRGLKESTGELIAFVDPDDWIDKYYLEILHQLLIRSSADLVISGGVDVLEWETEEKSTNWKMAISSAEVISKSEAYRRMLVCENNVSVTAWAKLYRKRLFDKVRYPVGKISEDSAVIDRIIEGCDRIVCTPYAGYYHLRRKGSLMHRRMNSEYAAGVINAGRLLKLMKEFYPDIEDAAKIFYYNNCIQLVNFMVLDPEKKYEIECQRMRKKILCESSFLIFSRYTKLEEKGAVICLFFGIGWYRRIWKMYLRMSGKAIGTVME